MMEKYYLSKSSLLNGNYSVHREECPFLPEAEKRIYLGKFNCCHDAVRVAKMVCLKSDGCYFCLKLCSQLGKKKSTERGYPDLIKVVSAEN